VHCGWAVEVEMLRILSTRDWAIVGEFESFWRPPTAVLKNLSKVYASMDSLKPVAQRERQAIIETKNSGAMCYIIVDDTYESSILAASPSVQSISFPERLPNVWPLRKLHPFDLTQGLFTFSDHARLARLFSMECYKHWHKEQMHNGFYIITA
jgi:hypothetical protein